MSDEGLKFDPPASGVVVKDNGDQTCLDATGYNRHVTHTDLHVGRVLCVMTSDRRRRSPSPRHGMIRSCPG
jgi:hypothetical protein